MVHTDSSATIQLEFHKLAKNSSEEVDFSPLQAMLALNCSNLYPARHRVEIAGSPYVSPLWRDYLTFKSNLADILLHVREAGTGSVN